MILMPEQSGPDLAELFVLFPPADYLRALKAVSPAQMPQPYRGLLVHEHHMTVTVEKHHGGAVDVRILARRHTGDIYARKILLALHRTGRVVQFGIMKINLRYCNQQVREEIVAGQTPLGRILIQHNVLRRIEPTGFLRVIPDPAMMKWFGLDKPVPTYGRLAIIHCNDQPAVELLEIVTPASA